MPRLHCIVIVYLVKTITINQVRRELPFGIEQGPPPLAATGILVRIFPVNFALQLTPVFGIVIQDDVDEGTAHLVLRRGIGNHLRFCNPAHRSRAQQRVHLVGRQRRNLPVDYHSCSAPCHRKAFALWHHARQLADGLVGIVRRCLLQNTR